MDIASVLERRRGRLAAKRAMDIVLSAGALCVLWPVFLLLAAAIVADDPGPVFYRQVRIGRGGKPFRIYKFRSMVVDADKKGLPITVGGDSRITRVGAFLRDVYKRQEPHLRPMARRILREARRIVFLSDVSREKVLSEMCIRDRLSRL